MQSFHIPNERTNNVLPRKYKIMHIYIYVHTHTQVHTYTVIPG